jgi:hypothetical protein
LWKKNFIENTMFMARIDWNKDQTMHDEWIVT